MSVPIRLKACEGCENIPDWLTQDHIDRCAADVELQANWKPAVGDWYFCEDVYRVLQIQSLESYSSAGDPKTQLPGDKGKQSNGRWRCDIFIPSPEQLAA